MSEREQSPEELEQDKLRFQGEIDLRLYECPNCGTQISIAVHAPNWVGCEQCEIRMENKGPFPHD